MRHTSLIWWDVPLPEQGSSPLRLPGRARRRAGCGSTRGYQGAVDARSVQALASGGVCMLYFYQPLEEQLFLWLGFAAARWTAQAWEGAQKCTLQGLIYIALINPKQASPAHMQILSKRQTASPFCISFNSLIFFLVWELLHLMRMGKNPLAWSWPFGLFGCTVSDKHQYLKSFCFLLLSSSEQKVRALGPVGRSGGTQACPLGTGLSGAGRVFRCKLIAASAWGW